MTKYHRPCTIFGETIEATTTEFFRFTDADETEFTLYIEHDAGRIKRVFASDAELNTAYLRTHFDVYKALNTPVRATKKVLDGLQDGIHTFEALLLDCGNYEDDQIFVDCYLVKGGWATSELELQCCGRDWEERWVTADHFIRATNAEALEYLLQFTTEGVKKDA